MNDKQAKFGGKVATANRASPDIADAEIYHADLDKLFDKDFRKAVDRGYRKIVKPSKRHPWNG